MKREMNVIAIIT